jgi:hypothetical protein
LDQEQATGTQCVADRESERDFPDTAIQGAAGGQMRTPVRLYEVMRIIRRQGIACAGIKCAGDIDGFAQGLAAGGGLKARWCANGRKPLRATRARRLLGQWEGLVRWSARARRPIVWTTHALQVQ